MKKSINPERPQNRLYLKFYILFLIFALKFIVSTTQNNIILTRNIGMRLILPLLWVTLLNMAEGILDRDYYEILDVPVSATPDVIKDAFRKQSKKYHPDRNPGAKDRFQKINVAYEVLMDEHKKYLYDRLGKDKINQQNIEMQFDLRSLKGPELRMKVYLPLKDFYLGKEFPILVEKQVACPHCKGSGAQNPYDIVTCQECNGQGRINRRMELGNGFYNIFTSICPRCEGKGKVIGRKCHLCSGQKITQGLEEFSFSVPAGAPNNFLIKYQNMGDERLEGAPSDLMYQLIEIPHPKFRREGNNLHYIQILTLREALLGFSKTITHLDGRQISISSQQIVQPGQIKIIEEQGMPIMNQRGKGNLFVHLQVEIPLFNDQQLNTLEQFFDEHKIK